MPLEDPDYKKKCMHLGTLPGIIANLLSDKYTAWRRKLLKEIFRGAATISGGVVSICAICKQGKHRSTATGWYVETAMGACGYRVGFQHLSWLAQDTVWCQRSDPRKNWKDCSRDNPALAPLRRRVEAEALECHASAVMS